MTSFTRPPTDEGISSVAQLGFEFDDRLTGDQDVTCPDQDSKNASPRDVVADFGQVTCTTPLASIRASS